MNEHSAGRLELSVNIRSLRFKAVSTAMTLGLTLVNLAKVEVCTGNLDSASWAAENARIVRDLLQECLLDAPFTKEELEWTDERLKEFEQAFDSLPLCELQFEVAGVSSCDPS
jgi:hypothetical protein